ncbi:bifunctional diaminohydroxyphosphoribosylaminopyrimidine deaminase/5-amino-6-(5-phosphoribosylamino)uracil reductase RibD [Marinoscillum sp. MHG1-6]|uniref:bifunctional diaminohydroxyphosphoribosylaminopyrimidine deaminase/5-amino-6-(5-phosphoribosylamino)uracil reductase RibD n=1 Tax=Marinoscillum sp. MHG1-6 TaxID=2959627 RepID=UPI0035BE1892
MTDQLFMQRALELAQLGVGSVAPNPMVGCVIVYEGKIIGEGYHELFGGPHAEVNAVNSVKDVELLSESTVYVTLEPCSHFGKTPPCADLLVEKKVKKVIICNDDPNPQVAGRGIRKLRDAGIAVEVGLLADKGLEINKRFFTFQRLHRPYVVLKWAQTRDGFVARENFDSKWISNAQSRQLVHKWRSEESSIMVGTNTAIYDNPSLTVRDWQGKNPVRVVIDRELKLRDDSNLFDGEVQTLVLTLKERESTEKVKYITLKNLEPESILEVLYNQKLLSVLIEGGSALLQSFIKVNLWDEARVFTSETKFERGIAAPVLNDEPFEEQKIGSDQLTCYQNK